MDSSTSNPDRCETLVEALADYTGSKYLGRELLTITDVAYLLNTTTTRVRKLDSGLRPVIYEIPYGRYRRGYRVDFVLEYQRSVSTDRPRA
jgi:hypothetical protein